MAVKFKVFLYDSRTDGGLSFFRNQVNEFLAAHKVLEIDTSLAASSAEHYQHSVVSYTVSYQEDS